MGWNWDILNGVLPHFILERLASVFIIDDEQAVDTVCWKYDDFGSYTVSSAYDVASSNSSGVQDKVWDKIWKIKAPSRMKTFLWLVMRERFMCNVERQKMGFTTDTRCMLCPLCLEDALLIFRGCKDADLI